MAQQLLVTTVPGTSVPEGGDIINDNFTELYGITDNLIIGTDVQAWDADLDTFASTGESAYLLVDGSRDLTGLQKTVALEPVADATSDFGSLTKRYNRLTGRQSVSAAGTGTATVQTASKGGLFVANFETTGTVKLSGTYTPLACIGRISGSGTNTVEATSGGAVCFGTSNSSGTGKVQAIQYGSVCFGYIFSTSSGADTVRSSGTYGSFVSGAIIGSGTGAGNLIASGSGSFANGSVSHTSSNDSGIRATANGAFVSGNAIDGTLIASGLGSMAVGRVSGGYTIQAASSGSVAFGSATAGNIYSSAINAMQLGVGSNAIANSFQVGENASLRGDGSLFLQEKSAATADIDAWGQLWVKTATPNQLWFTDDAGTDTQIV